MMPCTDSGRSTTLARSISMRTYSSAYSGLPPARASSAACGIDRQHWPLDERRRPAAPCRVSASGGERDRSAFGFPPPQPARRSSSSGRAVASDEQRHVAHPVDELVDEVEQRVVGPVQILEHEHRRAAARPAPRRSAARRRTPRPAPAAVPPRRPRRPADAAVRRATRLSASSATRRSTACAQLPAACVGAVAFEDARLRPSRSRRAPRSVTPLPYGSDLPWRQVTGARSSSSARRAPHEPALPDPGDADDRDELRLRAPRARARTPTTSSSSSRPRPTSGVTRPREAPATKRERAAIATQTATGSAFPFASTGWASRYSIASRRRAVGRLADQDAVDRGGRLQARGRIHDVAGDHPFAARAAARRA